MGLLGTGEVPLLACLSGSADPMSSKWSEEPTRLGAAAYVFFLD
jgi:hypothetical protein